MTEKDVLNDAKQPSAVNTRSELADIMRQACAQMGAGHYILLKPTASRGPKAVRILTSNWPYDWIEDLGEGGMARILESGHAACAGAPPLRIVTTGSSILHPAERRALNANGHAELFCQRVTVRSGQVYAIFSASSVGAIDTIALTRSHMAITYALEQFFGATGNDCAEHPLSERERECLTWVSEGKTTDEVALILGVSSNTVNSYVSHATQKFGAANRAMAIATAIRSGII